MNIYGNYHRHDALHNTFPQTTPRDRQRTKRRLSRLRNAMQQKGKKKEFNENKVKHSWNGRSLDSRYYCGLLPCPPQPSCPRIALNIFKRKAKKKKKKKKKKMKVSCIFWYWTLTWWISYIFCTSSCQRYHFLRDNSR